MSEVSLDASVCPERIESASINLDLLAPDVQACPWPAYKVMRDQGGVYRDPTTGFYLIVRYDELRAALLDDSAFNARHPGGVSVGRPWMETPIGQTVLARWTEIGWPPQQNLQEFSGQAHAQIRGMMSRAFTGQRMRTMEAVADEIIRDLIDSIIDDGRCEWIGQFALPLPLHVIGRATGVADEHLPAILACVDSYTSLLGLMDDEDVAMAHLDRVVSCQRLFQSMFERLRVDPDGSLISDLVNQEIPGQNRRFSDEELHTHLISSLFVAGAESTRNALGAGMRILIEHPEIWRKLKADPGKYVRSFVEEVLRRDSPAQGLYKFAQKDTELGGVTIPKGAVVIPRFGAANHDERKFPDPEAFDPERPGLASHFGFGAGPHMCLGAQLARAELRQAFTQIVERMDAVRFAEGRNDFAYVPNFILRGMKELHIEFDRRQP